MNYKTGTNVVKKGTSNYYPVLVIEFSQFKKTFYLKNNYLYSVGNYFFTLNCDEDGVMCATSEGEALSLINEFKSTPDGEKLIENFVTAVKNYQNSPSVVNPSQYLSHYFSIVRREVVITSSLLDNKYHTSPENF